MVFIYEASHHFPYKMAFYTSVKVALFPGDNPLHF